MKSGHYKILQQGIYVANCNGAIWDYKVIHSISNQLTYLVAGELVTGDTITGEKIENDSIEKSVIELLEDFSKDLPIIDIGS